MRSCCHHAHILQVDAKSKERQHQEIWLELGAASGNIFYLPPHPFDYEYASGLAPLTLRSYEVISHLMYENGKLKSHVSLLYSDYCALLGVKPKSERVGMEREMAAMHAPLVASGYLAGVDTSALTRHKKGWVVRFTVGEVARELFRSYSR